MPKEKNREYYLKKLSEIDKRTQQQAEQLDRPEQDDKEINGLELPQDTNKERTQSNDVSELLSVLGDVYQDEKEFGDSIFEFLSQQWTWILKKELGNETKKKLIADYPIPENCKLLKAPILNPELSVLLKESVKNRDNRIYHSQDQLGHAIAAIGKVITLFLSKKVEVPKVVVQYLSDACKLLNDLHCKETRVRANLIRNALDSHHLSIIENQERDKFLFGGDLAEKIKSLPPVNVRYGRRVRHQEEQPGPSVRPEFRPNSMEVHIDSSRNALPSSSQRPAPYRREPKPSTRDVHQ